MYLPPVCRSYKVWVGCRQHHLLSLSYLSLKSTKLHCIADKSATYFFSHLHHRNTSTATSHSNVPFTMYSMESIATWSTLCQSKIWRVNLIWPWRRYNVNRHQRKRPTRATKRLFINDKPRASIQRQTETTIWCYIEVYIIHMKLMLQYAWISVYQALVRL